ncbi:MAG TPA: hypothetical protein VGB73_13890 [Pyrinomonadaceae bacterium]
MRKSEHSNVSLFERELVSNRPPAVTVEKLEVEVALGRQTA